MTHSLLQNGLQAMKLTLSDSMQQQLLDYAALMQKWNQRMNLTGHQGLDKIIPLNILDSLAVLPYIKGQHVCDVGTGAGLPGIPLAIADPTRHYTLVDSRLKRIQFLRTVCRELKLDNVTPVVERAEKLQLEPLADTVVARAVTQAERLIELTQHLLAPGGQWLLMKGQDPGEELQSISLPHQTEKLHVPGVDGERCVVIVST
jgi:16S rRNA (guanine527-N7)-methyltransferase